MKTIRAKNKNKNTKIAKVKNLCKSLDLEYYKKVALIYIENELRKGA